MIVPYPFPPRADRRELKILTYNVHSCVGTDRQLDPRRIAEVIALSNADIIALQELDVGRKRTGGVDQAAIIAALLKMEVHFHPALHFEEERYGDAILTAMPTRLVRAGPLPSVGETRGAIWVQVDVGGWALNVLNTHLGLHSADRKRQIAALLSPDWIGNVEFQAAPAIVCGDFNAIPSSRAYKSLARLFRDAQLVARAKPKPTFPSRFPLFRIDHVFVSEELQIESAAIPLAPITRLASDHLPLEVSISLAEVPETPRAFSSVS